MEEASKHDDASEDRAFTHKASQAADHAILPPVVIRDSDERQGFQAMPCWTGLHTPQKLMRMRYLLLDVYAFQSLLGILERFADLDCSSATVIVQNCYG